VQTRNIIDVYKSECQKVLTEENLVNADVAMIKSPKESVRKFSSQNGHLSALLIITLLACPSEVHEAGPHQPSRLRNWVIGSG
jgi:hypothetical protein